MDAILLGGKHFPTIYTKVNKREVQNLSIVGAHNGREISVAWRLGKKRYVRFYNQHPRRRILYNKNRTKVRIILEGKYERTEMEA